MKKPKLILLLFLVINFQLITNNCSAQFTKLFSFNGSTNGKNPQGDLVSDGTYLYGMTYQGGANGTGLIFKIMPDGTGYVDIHDFVAGAYPQGSLVYDGTNFYGMTHQDGVNNFGTVFKIKGDGTGFAIMHDFVRSTTGAYPQGSLITDGTYLYGMTWMGGTNDNGVLFKIKIADNTFTKLLDFATASPTIGGRPSGNLYFDGTYLFGMTTEGGLYNLGLIFKIKPDGTGYANILDFMGADNGQAPYGSLISDATYLYGMTRQGGLNNKGVIFKIKKDGTNYVDLYDFNGNPNGQIPNGSLISDGTNLYGMTMQGGTSAACGANGCGTLFQIKTDGTGFTTILNFAGVSNGSFPYGSLISDGNNLFGMTNSGGLGTGIIFKYHLNVSVSAIALSNPVCNNQCSGSAAATATHGTLPYTFLWSNGETTSTATSLCAGTNTVTVTDNAGAITSTTVTITQPSAITSSISSQTNVSCYGGNNGSVTIAAAGGTGTLNYLWSPSTIGNSATVSGLAAGTYTCTITDANLCSKTQIVTITQPQILSIINTSINASCFNNDGTAGITVSGGTAPYTYLWSNSSASQIISGIAAGTYSVTATDFKGCSLVSTIVINNSTLPAAPSICMVTVDSNSINNEIYWDKTLPQYSIVDSFIVYRYDIISSSYLRIGAVSKDSLSMFTDRARNIGGPNGGDPQYSSYQYKLAVRDLCGNISLKSPYHQSIFVQQTNQNFSWNAYVIESSASVSGYQFMRDDNGTGAWHSLVNTSGLATTDPNFASFPNGRWRVQAFGLSCTPTRASINTSRSNIKHQGIATGVQTNDITLSDVKIYPNPTNDNITVEINQLFETTTLQIFNTLGQLMGDEIVLPASSSKTTKQINLSSYSKGIYILCIENKSNKRIEKIVVN